MSEKQDRARARTVDDIERRYNFGKTFAEVMGLATGARDTSDAALSAIANLNASLDQEEIFKRLTNDGTAQGLYRDDDGNLYINADYVQVGRLPAEVIDVEELLAVDIDMTGQFTSTSFAYIPPVLEDFEKMYKYLTGAEPIPAGVECDLDGNGVFEIADITLAFKVFIGKQPLKECRGAVKSEVTVRISPWNREQAICISGTNQWGSFVEAYIGIDNTNSHFVTRDYLDSMLAMDEPNGAMYRAHMFEDIVEYVNPPMEADTEYRTIERWMGEPVYTMIIDESEVDTFEYSIIRKGEVVNSYIQVWYIK